MASKSTTRPTGQVLYQNATLYRNEPKVFGIGRSIPPKRDLHRFVRWPKYVRIQRQRRVIYQRLKVPTAISQFSKTLDKNHASYLYKLLLKYLPENKTEKKTRFVTNFKAKNMKIESLRAKPLVIKYGIKHVTKLIEAKKARLVVIANDVDPIEIVCWLPTLCLKMGIPYLIVKSKANLGRFVHKKTATAIAIVGVAEEDSRELANLVEISDLMYFGGYKPQWGGGVLGHKSKVSHARTNKR
jgi:large subunit ribosomal protein L7Ae